MRKILKFYPEIKSVHPAAECFSLLSGDAFRALCASVSERGLQEPIVIDGAGVLLDGRNRLMACHETQTEVAIEVYDGDDQLEFILAKNVHRRHETPAQRAISGAKLLPWLEARALERKAEGGRKGKGRMKGANKDVANLPRLPAPKAREHAAAAVNVSPRSVSKAKAILEHADLEAACMSAEATLEQAYREAKKRERPTPKPPKTSGTIVLVDHEGVKVEYPALKSPAKFNATKGAEIEWAAWTWNPVTGCLHGCHYCYAREIALKSDMKPYYPTGFAPLYHHDRLQAPSNTPVPQSANSNPADGRVFVCSMADLFGAWVPAKWIREVVAVTVDNPQWEYLYLTKFPKRYARLKLPSSGWMGASVECQKRANPTVDAMLSVQGVKVRWLSVEPLLEHIRFKSLEGIDWLVIGSQSGTKQPDGYCRGFAPEFSWVADLAIQARESGCAVYMKSNLMGACGDQFPGMALIRQSPVQKGR